MFKQMRTGALAVVALACVTGMAIAGPGGKSQVGSPELQSAGPLAFAPDGVLLLGDPKAAAVFAIETGEKQGDAADVRYQMKNVTQKIADVLGSKQAVSISDLAVNPVSGSVYFSVTAGGQPAIVRIVEGGKLEKFDLGKVRFNKAALSDAPVDEVVQIGRRKKNPRPESITDLAYADGKVIVTGLNNDPKAPSGVRSLPYPFTDADVGASLEIYHAAHGRYEQDATVRAFVPFNINGKPHLLAGFTCTPLVKFPLSELSEKKSEPVRGTTVAELGNRNRPLDMVVYEKDGKTFLLMANSARGVMKVSTENIERQDGLTEPVRGGGTAGQEYETIKSLEGVVQLDKLNQTHAVVLIQKGNGAPNLETVELP